MKERALDLGFDLAGVAPIGVWKDLEFSRQWVEKGFNGEMRYLENPKRFDPRLVLPSAKSAICVALVYDAGFRSQESETRSRQAEARSKKAEVRTQETEERVSGEECDMEREAKDNVTNSLLRFAPAPSPEPPAPFIYNGQRTTDNGQPTPRAWISRYAWGRDYHEIMRTKLEQLRATVEELSSGVETRAFVDTGPVVERAFARFSGIGWMGKNTCIINQEKGSWFFLGVILTSLELEPDLPAPDRCGSCTACLEACPTGALVEPYVMDASRCISYLTIELRGPIPDEFRPEIGDNVFGCDICQDVCPWNGGHQSSVVSSQLSVPSYQQAPSKQREPVACYQSSAISYQQTLPPQWHSAEKSCARQAATTKASEFHPMTVALDHPRAEDGGIPKQLTTDNGQLNTDDGPLTTDDGPLTNGLASFSLFNPPLGALASISEENFRRVFAHSPIKRAKHRGWLRNLSVAMGNSGDERFVPWLRRAAQHLDPVVREHAAWALERLRGK